MNDNDGPWIALEEIVLVPLKMGRLRVVGKLRMEIADSLATVTISPFVEVDRGASIQELERGLLESARLSLVHAAALTVDKLEARLRGSREEGAQFDLLADDADD